MVNIIDRLERHASATPAAIAVSGSGISLTYAELWSEVKATGSMIERLCPGNSPIALHLENSPAWAVIDLALLHLGRACIPLPGFFTAQQRDHALRQSGAGHVITDGTFGQHETVARSNVHIHSCGSSGVTLPKGTAKVTFTSGSTGTPKGVCLSRAMLEETAAAIVDVVGSEKGALHCALLPLAVLLENVAGLYAILLAGGTYSVPRAEDIGLGSPFAPDFSRLATSLATMRATSVITVPELLRGLVATLSMDRQALPSLGFVAVGGARVSPRLLAQAASLGLPVYEGYGLSEAGSVVSLNAPGLSRPATAGQLLPHVRATVTSDGELEIHHPVFLGYAGEEAAPTVLHTGDLVSLDADGFLTVTGRRSAMIITSFGRNVAPEWVESELLAQPVIRQACVLGEGHRRISALIVPASAQITARQIAAAVSASNDCLPPYAAVTSWRTVPPFTQSNEQLTANGRLRRQNIAQAYAEAANSPHAYPEQCIDVF